MNDKSADECRFHPAFPKIPAGAGNLLYAAEWHACREKCSTNTQGPCQVSQQHYYGTHLGCKNNTGQVKLPSPSKGTFKVTATVSTMTDVSLLYNPFKGSADKVKDRPSSRKSLSPTPRADEIVARSLADLSCSISDSRSEMGTITSQLDQSMKTTLCPKHRHHIHHGGS